MDPPAGGRTARIDCRYPVRIEGFTITLWLRISANGTRNTGNFRNTRRSGKREQAVEFPKQAWKEAAAVWAPAEAEEYFQRWVVIDPGRLRFAMLTGKVIRDCFVSHVVNLEMEQSEPAQGKVG